MDVIFNELSVLNLAETSEQAVETLNAWFQQMIQLQVSRKVRITFLSPLNNYFVDAQLAKDGYYFRQWLSQLPKENKTIALALVGKKPIEHSYPEYWMLNEPLLNFKDQECKGFGYAIEQDILAWSFDPHKKWTASTYTLSQRYLNEQSGELEEEQATVWHLPAAGETSIHDNYWSQKIDAVSQQILLIANSGQILIDQWDIWFSALQLTKTARKGILEIPTPALVRDVTERLLVLQRFFQVWDKVPIDYSILGYHTNGEGGGRQQQLIALTLSCPDGKSRLMNWHMRYPLGQRGAGRIFFVPESDNGHCFIGYIGHKDGVT